MSRKIAPMLKYVTRNYGSGYTADALRRELRALLAVARAARGSMTLHKHYGDGGCHEPEADALRRALARLDRVSGARAALAEEP